MLLSMPEFAMPKNKPRLIINDGSHRQPAGADDLLLRAYKELLSERIIKNIFRRVFRRYPVPAGRLTPVLTDTRGLTMNPDNILITRGGPDGYLSRRTAELKKGDRVIVSRPNYFMADKAFYIDPLLQYPVHPTGTGAAWSLSKALSAIK